MGSINQWVNFRDYSEDKNFGVFVLRVDLEHRSEPVVKEFIQPANEFTKDHFGVVEVWRITWKIIKFITTFDDMTLQIVRYHVSAPTLQTAQKAGSRYKCSLADAPGRWPLQSAQQQIWTSRRKLKCSRDHIRTWIGLSQRRYHSIHQKYGNFTALFYNQC